MRGSDIGSPASSKTQDSQLLAWLRQKRIPFLPVYTKMDKLSGNERMQNAAMLDSGHDIKASNRVLFSAKTGQGREELIQALSVFGTHIESGRGKTAPKTFYPIPIPGRLTVKGDYDAYFRVPMLADHAVRSGEPAPCKGIPWRLQNAGILWGPIILVPSISAGDSPGVCGEEKRPQPESGGGGRYPDAKGYLFPRPERIGRNPAFPDPRRKWSLPSVT